MKRLLICILVLLLVLLSGCSDKKDIKDIDTKVAIPNSEEVLAEIEEVEEVQEGDVFSEKWESHFEDPIFAQAWRNFLEYEINEDVEDAADYKTIEEYGVKNALVKTNVFIGLQRNNIITGDSLSEDFREKMTSINGFSAFGKISGINLNGVKNIPQEKLLEDFKKVNTRVISKLDISYTQIDNFEWLDIKNLEEVKMAHTNMDNEDLKYIADRIDGYYGIFDISYTNITEIPEFKGGLYLDVIMLEGLKNFKAESLNILGGASQFISFKNTELDYSKFQMITPVLNVENSAKTVEDLKYLTSEHGVSTRNMIIDLEDYTGFGELLNSGTFLGNNQGIGTLGIKNAHIDKAFMEELSVELNPSYRINFFDPTFDLDGQGRVGVDAPYITDCYGAVVHTRESDNVEVPDEFWSYFYDVRPRQHEYEGESFITYGF